MKYVIASLLGAGLLATTAFAAVELKGISFTESFQGSGPIPSLFKYHDNDTGADCYVAETATNLAPSVSCVSSKQEDNQSQAAGQTR